MLGLEPLRRSLEAALRDAHDAKERVRLSAVRDLSHHAAEGDGEAAVAALVRALETDASPEVRGAAALSLADARAQGSVDALLAAASEANLHVRQMAVIALGELGVPGDARVTEVIRGALDDRAPALRFQALIAANRLDIPFAEEALLAAMDDPDAEVRHVGVRLLEERSMVEGGDVRPSDAARSAAKRRLRDEALSVRLAAAILLGRAGDRAGNEALVEGVVAAGASLDPEDVQAAVVLAGELGLSEAVPALERRAFRGFGRGRNFSYEARTALARMGDARAKAAILRALSAYSRDTRTLAVVAAGRANLFEALPIIAAMKGDERRADPSAVEEALKALDPSLRDSTDPRT